jgi:phage-related protein (TIGR01555 family)
MADKKKKQNNVANKAILNNQIFNEIGQYYTRYTTKALYNTYQLEELAISTGNPLSNNRSILEGVYSANGVIRRIIDTPVHDAFKQGLNIKSDILDKEDIALLSKAVHRNIVPVVIKALKYARLFGGSAILLEGGSMQETQGEDLTEAEKNSLQLKTPFSIEDLEQGGNFTITALSLWELNMAGDWQNPQYTQEKAKYDFLTNNTYYNVYGNKIDKSRLIPLIGDEAPPEKQQLLQGWGFSVLESIIVSLQMYIKQTKVLFECLDETKISHISIPDLKDAVQTDDGRKKLTEYVAEIAQLKNYFNLIVGDKEAGFEQKQINFAWLKEAQDALQNELSSAVGIPKNKLFGDSAGGFASGQDALENYNTGIQYLQENILPTIEKLVYLEAKKLFGDLGEAFNLDITFPSLKVLSEEQESVMAEKKLNALLQLYDRGIITATQVKEELNTSKALNLNLTIEEGEEDFPEPNFTPQAQDEL